MTAKERIHENALRYKAKQVERKGFSVMWSPEAKQRVVEINKLLGTNYVSIDNFVISK